MLQQAEINQLDIDSRNMLTTIVNYDMIFTCSINHLFGAITMPLIADTSITMTSFEADNAETVERTLDGRYTLAITPMEFIPDWCSPIIWQDQLTGEWHEDYLYFWICERGENGIYYAVDFFHNNHELAYDIWAGIIEDEPTQLSLF